MLHGIDASNEEGKEGVQTPDVLTGSGTGILDALGNWAHRSGASSTQASAVATVSTRSNGGDAGAPQRVGETPIRVAKGKLEEGVITADEYVVQLTVLIRVHEVI